MTLVKTLLATAALAAASAGALAEPINKYTITGRASAAAVAQDVPLDQSPKPPAPDQAAAGEPGPNGAVAVEAAPPKPRVERYGLFGMSWRSH